MSDMALIFWRSPVLVSGWSKGWAILSCVPETWSCFRACWNFCPSICVSWDVFHWRSARSGSGASASVRSEEHTSELQSLMRISYAVFCLKKKNNHILLILDTISRYGAINRINDRYARNELYRQ